MPINWGFIREQIIEASVLAVNATADNTALRAKDKAPIRKVFAGGRQTVRFKTASEIEQGKEMRSRLGLGAEVLAGPSGIARAKSMGFSPISSTRVGGSVRGFARTIEAPGRVHTGGSTVQSYVLSKQWSGRQGEIVNKPRKNIKPESHQDRPRNLSNRANEFRATHDVRLLNPLDYSKLLDSASESRLTAAGRYELASRRAVTHAAVSVATERSTVSARVGGSLRDSIRVERASADMFPDIKASVVAGGNGVDYAKFQELGTRHNPEHPFLRPSLMEARGELPAQLLRSLKRLGR